MISRCLTTALVALSGDLVAQVPSHVVAPDSGAWVRYTIPPSASWLTGRVLGRDGRTIRVQLKRAKIEETVSLDSMQRFQLGRRRTPGDGAWRGALIGLATGVGFVLAVTLVDGYDCNRCSMPEPVYVGLLVALPTLGLTVGGAVLGAASPGVAWPSEDAPRQSSSRRDSQVRLGLRLPLPGSH